MRRLLPLAISLGVGLVVLLWGLATLESILIDERRAAHEGITSQESALAEYARRTLELRLQGELHQKREAFDRAIADPLAATDGLLLIDLSTEGGRQQLPPRPAAAPGTATPARALYDQLRQRAVPDGLEVGSPTHRRVELFMELRDAIDRDEVSEVSDATWALLRHRTMFVVDSAFDLPLMIALLDDFVEHSHPAPELMLKLLRDGYGRQPDAHLDAIQRLLLRRRDRFTEADFRFLAERVVALSHAGGVDVDDFEVAAYPESTEPIERPPQITGPTLLDGGRWYATVHSPSQVRGVQTDAPTHVDAIEEEMRLRGLLTPDDRLSLPSFGSSELSSLPIEVHAPRLTRARAEAEDRFWLKTAFVAGCALLALVIVVLAVSLQRRRHRFVELKSDFVATVSHELRTPLASIRLMAETLERRTKDIPAAKDYPSRIVRDIDELSFLVENILSFNRLDKGRWEPRRSDVELTALIDEILDDLPDYGFADVQVQREGIDDVVLHGDRELLKLLLRNLIKNACTYNERQPVELSLRGREQGAHWELTVADNGVGIPEGEQTRIFEDFRRVAGTRARGSGLGLSICRKTMEAHGGRIRIASSSPEGTRFALTFPAAMVGTTD